MKKIAIVLIIAVLSVGLIGCDTKKSKPTVTAKIVVAKLETPTKHLYFAGTIQPIKTVSILSPVEGRIEKLNFVYGQGVKQGQVLAVVNSLKLMDDFRTAVGAYLSKKTAYLNQAQTFDGTKVLYKAGVIDKENFQNAQSQYENSVLDFFQQEYELQKVLSKANIKASVIEKLNITDVEKIKKLYASALNHIKIKALTSGVALFPLPSQGEGDSGGDNDSDGDGGSGNIAVGSKIREGQLVLSIGNLSGFSIDMQVNEVSVNSLHDGMAATVTGDAFPGVNLKGLITYVASQAQPSQGGASASVFKVTVTVPHVTAQELKTIHVGMTAKVDIAIKGVPRVMVPINAVHEKNGTRYVTVIESNAHKEVPVITGATTPTGVAIVSGVKEGQRVYVPE